MPRYSEERRGFDPSWPCMVPRAVVTNKRYYDRHIEVIRKRAREKVSSFDPKRRAATARRTGLRKYGLTPEKFDQMRIDQKDTCLLCEQQFIALPHVDHDHETGIVRGLLCVQCNVWLGRAEKFNSLLRRAEAYLITGHKPTGA